MTLDQFGRNAEVIENNTNVVVDKAENQDKETFVGFLSRTGLSESLKRTFTLILWC